MKTQPRLKHRREALPSCVSKEIRAAINADARRYNCSRSWVVAVALATIYDIDIVKPYETKKRREGLYDDKKC